VAVAHRALDRRNQMARRVKAERDRIADVQVADARACRLNFLGFRDDTPDRIREAVNAIGGRNRRGRARNSHGENLTSQCNSGFTQIA
jgi:hypothetical protein